MRTCTEHGVCTDCAKCRDIKDVRLSVDLSDIALAIRLLGVVTVPYNDMGEEIAVRIDAIAKELLQV